MNKDRVQGKTTEIAGKVKEGAGKLTGNDRLKAEGQTDQVKGKAQNAWGNVKDVAQKGAQKVEDVSKGMEDSLRHGHETRSEKAHEEDRKKKDVA